MTLEDYFYSFEDKLDYFPGRHNYVSAYKTFKDFMDKEVHKETKAMTLVIDEGDIFLNDHSADHIRMVIEKVSRILWHEDEQILDLNPLECFILLSAIQIHDAGHVIGGREHHEYNAKEFLKRYDSYVVGSPEKKIIYEVARAHSGKDDPIGKLPQSEDISNFRVRMRLLAALLRLGDEMADEASRASAFLFEQNKIVKGSRLFHAFSMSLNSFLPHVDTQEIGMRFNLNKSRCSEVFKKPTKDGGEVDTYLLDEIYERTFKTFRECLYYNRFVSDKLRFNSVSVTIEFYDDDNFIPFFDTIGYRLQEKGYPRLKEENVYALCGKDLEKDGAKLDGEFVKNNMRADGNQEQ